MKLEVTREVVSDLWPLCRAGEASADSRAVVDAFLSGDREFAAVLQESESLPPAIPALRLSPDAERRLLDEARGRARLKLMVVGGAILLAGIVALTALGGLLYMMIRG